MPNKFRTVSSIILSKLDAIIILQTWLELLAHRADMSYENVAQN